MLNLFFSAASSRGHQLVFAYPSNEIIGLNQMSDILSPKKCDSRFQLRVDNVVFIGHPTLLHQDRLGTGLKFTRALQKEEPNPYQLSMFNFVLAYNDPSDEFIDHLYQEIILKVTAALKHEQLRRGYVRSEIELILGLKEDSIKRDIEIDNSLIVQNSSLAKTLVHIFDSIKLCVPFPICINNSVNLFINPELFQANEYPTIRPYSAVLLLQEPNAILADLSIASSPHLLEFVAKASPTVTLYEFQSILSLSLLQIYKLVSHLVAWKKAIVIHPISTRNIYVLSPDAKFELLPELSGQFNNLFPDLELTKTLQDLSLPKVLSSTLPSKDSKKTFLEVVGFLLRYNLVQQLNTYIYLTIPASICAQVNKKLTEVKQIGPMMINVDAITQYERELIDVMLKPHGEQIITLFNRLLCYFNGQMHIEEIMFRENISRKDLKALLNLLHNELLTVLHP
jgi:hypothetical protein